MTIDKWSAQDLVEKVIRVSLQDKMLRKYIDCAHVSHCALVRRPVPAEYVWQPSLH